MRTIDLSRSQNNLRNTIITVVLMATKKNWEEGGCLPREKAGGEGKGASSMGIYNAGDEKRGCLSGR